MKSNNVILGWGNGIRRSISLSKEFDFEDVQIPYIYKNKYLKPINYIVNSVKTLSYLIKNKPVSIVVVTPPTLILYPIFLYTAIINKQCKFIVDCHNGVLRKEWKNIPFTRYIINKSANVISHNSTVKKDIDDCFGVNSFVLGDPLITYDLDNVTALDNTILIEGKVNVLVPVSYAKDEPIDEIVKAGERLEETHNFILTGRYTKYFKINEQLPGITFTGFISESEYTALVDNCELMLCLTKDDSIQMCAVIEAVSMLKNVVCTDNSVNRDVFSPYKPTFTQLTSKDIAENVRIASSLELSTDERAAFVLKYTKSWQLNAKDVFHD